MQVTITKQTYWGGLSYFTFYKNGVRQGKIFTNVPVNVDVEAGDVLTFHEGWLQLPRRIEVLPDTKEITIVNTRKVQQLFFICLMLFISISLLFLSIQTFSRFVLAEIGTYLVIQWFFNNNAIILSYEDATAIYRLLFKKARSFDRALFVLFIIKYGYLLQNTYYRGLFIHCFSLIH